MGSFINIFERSDDFLHKNTTVDQTLIDFIDEMALEINLSFVKVRISEVKID